MRKWKQPAVRDALRIREQTQPFASHRIGAVSESLRNRILAKHGAARQFQHAGKDRYFWKKEQLVWIKRLHRLAPRTRVGIKLRRRLRRFALHRTTGSFLPGREEPAQRRRVVVKTWPVIVSEYAHCAQQKHSTADDKHPTRMSGRRNGGRTQCRHPFLIRYSREHKQPLRQCPDLRAKTNCRAGASPAHGAGGRASQAIALQSRGKIGHCYP